MNAVSNESMSGCTAGGGRERGAATLVTLVAVLVLLSTVLTATQVLVSLQRRSVARALVLHAATQAARFDEPGTEQLSAALIASLGPQTTVDWRISDDAVAVVVDGQGPAIIGWGPLAALSRFQVRVTTAREVLVG